MEREPLYTMVTKKVLNRIKNHEYSAGGLIPGEKEFIKEFNVSRIVVSKALTTLAGQGVILRIPGKGSFVAEDVMSNLYFQEFCALQQTAPMIPVFPQQVHAMKTIAIVAHRIDAFAGNLLNGISNSLYEHGYLAQIYLTNSDLLREESCIRQAHKSSPSGMILLPSDRETYNNEVMQMQLNHFPFIFVDRKLAGLDAPFVCSDNIKGTGLATQHLIELGHKRIAICSATQLPTQSTNERINGFLLAMSNSKLMVDPSLLLTDLSNSEKMAELDEIMKNGTATAYICLNIQDFEIVYSMATKYHVRIPEDISIITFDNLTAYNLHGIEPTHLAQDVLRISEKAAEMIIQRVNHPHEQVESMAFEPFFYDGWTTARAKE